MAGTRLGEAIDAIIGILRAGTTAALLGADAVIDGPENLGDDVFTAVFIGYDGDPDGDAKATENWTADFVGAPVGRQQRDESFEINGAVISWGGDTDVASRRADALAAFNAVETDLRGRIDLGIGVGVPTTAQITAMDLYQEQDPAHGAQARIPFRVGVITRI